ncbi:hypothetical protein [Symbioplanes lichenis]|uniref:hypothetical protein n=1 Tax=Symbioplanes lichenis TaxID=1629072 RepID=UPI00273A59A9|nr:hypothetical protein [Actinoplanes lichenis]
MPLATDGPAVSPGEWDGLIGKLESTLRAVQDHVEQLFAGVNSVVAKLPAVLADALNEALTQLAELISEFYRRIAEALAGPGLPPALAATGRTWREQITEPVTALVTRLKPEPTWRGPAAEAFAATLPAQQQALIALRETASSVSNALHKTSGALVALWTGIAAAVTRYDSELRVAAAGAGTIVGAPIAATNAATATIRVTKSVATGIAAYARQTAGITATFIELRAGLASGPLAGGWPVAVAPATGAGAAAGAAAGETAGAVAGGAAGAGAATGTAAGETAGAAAGAAAGAETGATEGTETEAATGTDAGAAKGTETGTAEGTAAGAAKGTEAPPPATDKTTPADDAPPPATEKTAPGSKPAPPERTASGRG